MLELTPYMASFVNDSLTMLAIIGLAAFLVSALGLWAVQLFKWRWPE